MAVIMIAILAFGGFYINKTRSAISNISGETTEVTQMAVYVKSDDAADSVEATAGYTYGILSSLDRENTDGAVAHLNSEFGTEVQTKEYAGLTELADGILNGEVNAMLSEQRISQCIRGYGRIHRFQHQDKRGWNSRR